MKSILHLTDYSQFAGERVRVLWNPEVRLWYVYNLTENHPIFSTFRLELHTVGVYGELKPKFAPNGTPSFVGTICAHEMLKTGVRVNAHPYAPAKMFFQGGEVQEFDHCRRILLNKSTMLADTRPLLKDK